MLRPDTQSLWKQLQPEPALAGFVLIGGSALALHFRHRVSEDLDFAFVGTGAKPADKLPRQRLSLVLDRVRAGGISVQANDAPADWQEYEAAGLDLLDYQQNYLVGGVRASFFTPETSLGNLLRPGVSGSVRLADVDELFRSKALVVADRSKTRDWFDLYHLLTTSGYTMRDFARVFHGAGQRAKFEIAMDRLCSGRPGIGDEGFASLLPDPPTVEELTCFFVRERNRFEVDQGESAFGQADPM